MSFITPYKPIPVAFTQGKGMWLSDSQGNQYLDAMAGIAVTNLGHQHPKIVAAITEQAQKVLHTSNIFTIEKQQQLAEKLHQMTGMKQAFFANSGAEANEAAIKIARLFGHQKNIQTPTLIVMQGAFHGRTMATLTATGSRKAQAGFEPLVPGFVRAEFNDIAGLKAIAQNHPDIVGIMVEPIQGEGGVNIPSDDYLPQLRQLCDEHDWLLILDEIQTGMGRTGKLFAYEHYGITPDVLTSAKALGNGIPISACLLFDKVVDILKPGTHGSTFGGNPFACNVALAVLDELAKGDLIRNAQTMGDYLLGKLRERFAEHSGIKSIRGKGLMIGIECDRECKELVKLCVENRLLITVTSESVIRILPPLILSKTDADELVARLGRSLDSFFN